MIEIKFRLIRNGKIVGYEKWFPGKKLLGTKVWIRWPRWMYSNNNRYWDFKYIPHDTKKQFIGLSGADEKELYDGSILEHESGNTYVAGKHGDITHHYVEWCPRYGGWVMYGINQETEDGTPTKNMLNTSYTDGGVYARCYPIVEVGNVDENPEMMEADWWKKKK